MARLYDWLTDQQRNPKIIGSRLNDEFDNIFASPTFTGTLTANTYTGSGDFSITKSSGTLSFSLTASASQVQTSFAGSGGCAYFFQDTAAGADLKYMTLVSAAGTTLLRTLTDLGAVKNLHLSLDHSSGNTTISQNTGLGTTALTSAFVAIAAGSTGKSQINFAASTAPTSPNNGDFWFDGTNVKIRVAGATKTFTLT